jgi:hypothetical protein
VRPALGVYLSKQPVQIVVPDRFYVDGDCQIRLPTMAGSTAIHRIDVSETIEKSIEVAVVGSFTLST